MASSEMAPGTPDGSVNSTSLHKEGPVLSLMNKRLRALRKKYSRILQIEDNKLQGKVINKEQEEVLRSKIGVAALIDEYEKLKQPLNNAIKEELAERERELMASVFERRDEERNFANGNENRAANNEDETNELGTKEVIVNGSSEEIRKDYEGSSVVGEEAPHSGAIADLLSILYFAHLFNVRSHGEFASLMWTKMHERSSCLSYDFVTEDATNPLTEGDLDALSILGSIMTSRLPNATLSHKDAIENCVRHARQWLLNSNELIHPDLDVSYSGLRERLNRILSSEYFTMTPELKTVSQQTAAAAATAAGQYVTEVLGHEPSEGNAPLQLEDASSHYSQQDQTETKQKFYNEEDYSYDPVDVGDLSNSVADVDPSFSHASESNTPSVILQNEVNPISVNPSHAPEQYEPQHQQLHSLPQHPQPNQQQEQQQSQQQQAALLSQQQPQQPRQQQQQYYSRNGGISRGYQGQRGGRGMGYGAGGRGRIFVNGRGRSAGRGGSYAGNYGQYYDRSNQPPRNYYGRRGRGTRGGGMVYDTDAAGPTQATVMPE